MGRDCTSVATAVDESEEMRVKVRNASRLCLVLIILDKTSKKTEERLESRQGYLEDVGLKVSRPKTLSWQSTEYQNEL